MSERRVRIFLCRTAEKKWTLFFPSVFESNDVVVGVFFFFFSTLVIKTHLSSDVSVERWEEIFREQIFCFRCENLENSRELDDERSNVRMHGWQLDRFKKCALFTKQKKMLVILITHFSYCCCLWWCCYYQKLCVFHFISLFLQVIRDSSRFSFLKLLFLSPLSLSFFRLWFFYSIKTKREKKTKKIFNKINMII